MSSVSGSGSRAAWPGFDRVELNWIRLIENAMASSSVAAGRERRRTGAALIGGGFIGPVHAEALRRIGVDVVGLLGSSPERARPLADRLGIAQVYRDLDAVLADPAVGAVHVASPNAHHFAQAQAALRAGKHVLCEKPLATTPRETSALVALAAQHPKQVAAVNYNVRFYPLCHELHARVARGDLGRILSISGCYTQDWLLKPDDYNWRVEPDGGTNLRAIADIGTHWMDLAQFVLGRPIHSVFADLATFHARRRRPIGPSDTFSGTPPPGATSEVTVRTEDYGAVLLRWDDGTRGIFHVSQTTAGRKNRIVLEVAGTLGSLAWDSDVSNRLWIGRRDCENQLLERDPALLSPAASAITSYPGGHAEGFPDTFKQLFLAVYEAITAGDSAPPRYPTFADGDREVRLCEAIARSAREERWVEVSPPE
jgi:predicted dehydrogenase